MKASEYIRAMQALIEEHGDLEVETLSVADSRRRTVRPPYIGHRKRLTDRESKPQFWSPLDNESFKGEKVIQV